MNTTTRALNRTANMANIVAGLNPAVAVMIARVAWEERHAHGVEEVEMMARDMVEELRNAEEAIGNA